MINHFDVVAFERSKYPAPEYDGHGKLLNPLGNEHAGTITNAACYTIRSEGWGLRLKPAGTNWNGRALDVMINKKLHVAVDCLGDAEGSGTPVWNEIKYETWFDAEWVAPTDPAAPPVPPEPPTPPTPPTPPVPPPDRHTLVSPNGKFSLSMQSDGNLVIYTAVGLPIWASNSAQKIK